MLNKFLVFFVLLIFFVFPKFILAQQGCCSHHGGVAGCSASGRKICMDGSLSPSCTCGSSYSYTYTPSAPSPVSNGKWTYNISSQNSCNYDVSMTWDEPLGATQYSISMTKVAGSDPGPYSDTKVNSYTFHNYESGVWYINIKSGNGNWSKVMYWKLDLPKIEPGLRASIEGNYINYELRCLKEYNAPKFLVDYINNNQANFGKVSIPSKTPATYIIEGTDFNGKKYKETLYYNPPQNSNESIDLTIPVILVLGGVGFLGWWIKR